jgi:hypothetical protein
LDLCFGQQIEAPFAADMVSGHGFGAPVNSGGVVAECGGKFGWSGGAPVAVDEAAARFNGH